jgi:hypothetical protein
MTAQVAAATARKRAIIFSTKRAIFIPLASYVL